MRVAVIANFMAGSKDLARDFGQPANVRADLKKRGGGAMAGEDFEQLGSCFAGSVVESERDGWPGSGAAMNGRGEERTGRDSNGVGQHARRHHGRTERQPAWGFQDACEVCHMGASRTRVASGGGDLGCELGILVRRASRHAQSKRHFFGRRLAFELGLALKLGLGWRSVASSMRAAMVLSISLTSSLSSSMVTLVSKIMRLSADRFFLLRLTE